MGGRGASDAKKAGKRTIADVALVNSGHSPADTLIDRHASAEPDRKPHKAVPLLRARLARRGVNRVVPMNRKNRPRGPRRVIIIEGLERRELLSGEPWAPAAKLIGQDLAVAHYPKLTGAGEAVAVIDSGVDYKHPSLGGGFGAGKKVEAGWDFISNDADPMSDTF